MDTWGGCAVALAACVLSPGLWNLQASLPQKASFPPPSLNFSERRPISSCLISGRLSAVAAGRRLRFRRRPEPSAPVTCTRTNFGNVLHPNLLVSERLTPPSSVLVLPHVSLLWLHCVRSQMLVQQKKAGFIFQRPCMISYPGKTRRLG